MNLKKTVLGAARLILSGEKGEAFTMRPSQRTEFPASSGTQDFYAHIPYCRNHCAYCPYNTKPLDVEEVPDFYEALLAAPTPEVRSTVLEHARKVLGVQVATDLVEALELDTKGA